MRHPDIRTQTPWFCEILDLKPPAGDVYLNPTICRTADGRTLLFVRRVRDSGIPSANFRGKQYFNDIQMFPITGDFVVGDRYTLPLPQTYGDENIEDPRALAVGNKVWLSCCTFIKNKSHAHQSFFQLDEQLRVLMRMDPVYGENCSQCLLNDGHEKNWLYFAHNGDPYMIYHTFPHEVVAMDGQLRPRNVYRTKNIHKDWKYGQPRGGTPPIFVNGEWWSFFHSSIDIGPKQRQYFVGAYAFSEHAPFTITRMTAKPLLKGSDQHPRHQNGHLVVFPGGATFVDNTWTVVFGVNDVLCGRIIIPHKDLETCTAKL